MTMLGRAGASKIRGDFSSMSTLSGIFMFMMHIKTVSAVAGVGASNNPMALHSPMNVMVMLLAAAFAFAIYERDSCHWLVTLLFVYSVMPESLRCEIQEPGGAFAMFILAWFEPAAPCPV